MRREAAHVHLLQVTQDNVEGCSDWISDSMNRTGNHICGTSWDDSQWQCGSHWFFWGICIQLGSEDQSMTQLCN